MIFKKDKTFEQINFKIIGEEIFKWKMKKIF